MFTTLVIGLPQMFGMAEGWPLLVATATLAVAVLLNSLRRRLQGWVDRRFNRVRYNAQPEVDSMADRLRGDLRPDELARDVLGVVVKTMGSASAAVWIEGDVNES